MVKTYLKMCYGVSSECFDPPFHVFMADYDNISLKYVTKHLLFLQKEYKLDDIYIIKSKNGFNAICLDKLPFSLIFSMGTDAFSPCDRDFFRYGFNRGYFVLRFDGFDKSLESILCGFSNAREKSSAHREFLEWFFGIKIENNDLFDNNTRIRIVQYPSGKNGYHVQAVDMPENYIETLKRLKL